MPALRDLRRFDPMIAHAERQPKVPAQKGANGAGRLWILNDPVHKPILEQDLIDAVVVVNVEKLQRAPVDLVGYHPFQNQQALAAEIHDLLVIECRLTIVMVSKHITHFSNMNSHPSP